MFDACPPIHPRGALGPAAGLIRRSREATRISSFVFSAVAIGAVSPSARPSESSLIIGLALIGLVGLVTVPREATGGPTVVVADWIGDLLPMALT